MTWQAWSARPYTRELALRTKIAKREAKAAAGLILRDELKHRNRLLRRMGYVSEEGVVMTKGRVACEMTTADELVATELVFNGTFKVPSHGYCSPRHQPHFDPSFPELNDIQ